ncbi:hypothetical protein DPM13_07905 [Paracoccus mutanolyticus]|uniref:Uncharacterized protein n=1 Tax=Paracoccus mutanolyticus TaxID=1499308 RepID=A0ABN5MDE4_9RHOB|nr:hypothetical protein DPM13_07905 [Paracoccus mutanolyticus]
MVVQIGSRTGQCRAIKGAPAAYPFHAQVREATAPIFYEILTRHRQRRSSGLHSTSDARELRVLNAFGESVVIGIPHTAD